MSSETEALIERLRDEQQRRCAYWTRDGDGRPCDCKYGAVVYGVRGEMTGCPELRAAIWLLDAATPTPASDEGARA